LGTNIQGNDKMIRILFLIRSLGLGGAERQLTELVKGLDKDRFAITVMTFYDGGPLRTEIEGIYGVNVISLRKQGRWDVILFLWRLWRSICEAQPQIIHGNMGISNELSLIMGRMIGARVMYALQSSYMDFSRYDWAAKWAFRVGSWFSGFTDLIVVNSHAGRQHHVAHNYCGDRMIIIPNGFDTERFCPNAEVRQQVRCEWGVRKDEQLIGLVGRLDPMKDHPTFLQAAALIAQERHDVRFVCVGDGPAPYKQELWALSKNLGLDGRLIWAGARSDMPCIYNALDIATSSSYGEGLSNVIGEAMSCGVPCVVTDVGDSAAIVGNSVQVVPPRDPRALMEGWIRLLDLPTVQRAALAEDVRTRIVREYSVQQLVRKTETALISLLG
jgi:glycosyltransferase involved in cell wall biosynthesis